MNVSFLFKDFLSLEDVGEYLNQHGYSYDPEIEEDYYRLKATVLDLYNEKKLSIVFYYDDFASIKTLRFCENLGVEEIKDEEFELYISGYFHVPEAPSILKTEGNLAILESSYRYYLLHDIDQLPIYDREEYKVEVGHKFTSIEFGDSLAPSVIDFYDLRFPKADLDKLFNDKNSELKSIKDELADVKAQNAKLIADKEENKATGSFMMGTPTVAHDEPKTIEQFREALAAANAKVGGLDSQLKQAIATLADKPANSVTHSNTDMQNVKKAAIRQFNRSLATVLIELDYKEKLRKGDIANYIVPHMKQLAFALADEDMNKANNLTVTYSTLYDTHLQDLNFKQGRQSNADKNKINIDLLFKKQLPVTE